MEYNRVKLGMYDDPRKHQNEEEELLIFGYSCKLFRDDDRALSIENCEHLIPWMDSNLMIDRFDVRGALYDLTEAESKGKPAEECLSEVELKEEQLCEQERYLALYHDELQHQMECEEEAKRLQVELASDGSLYNQVGFSYAAQCEDGVPLEPQNIQAKPEPVSETVSYNPTSDDDIFIPPKEMNILPNMEVPKTVKQNKIILKTAKFIVSQGAQMEIIIKTKQAGNPMFNFLAFDNPLNAYYKHVISLIRTGRFRFDDDTDSATAKPEQNDSFLHPNLSQKMRPDLTPGVAASPSRPSPHCSYSKLITKIKEKQKVGMEDTEVPSPILPSSPVHENRHTTLPPPRRLSSEPVVGLVDYPSFNQTADGGSDTEEAESPFARRPSKVAVHDYSNIKWPPPEIQMVIDKMASYIIKNGSAFEDVVKSRGDARFDFLHKHHEYYPYYKCKFQLYNEVYGDIFKNVTKNQKKTNATSSSKTAPSENMKNGGGRTISFSIKSREQEVPLTSHTTFPIESSTSEEDEDMEDDERERRRIERERRRKDRKMKEDKERRDREEWMRKERQRKEEEERKREREDESSGNEDLYDIFKYAQEMERDTGSAHRQAVSPAAAGSPEEGNSKQEERKKKAAAFLSKIKDSKEEQKPIIYGPQMPPDIAAGMIRSVTQSPSSSSGSSEREKPPLPPPPNDPPPPPPPKSPSPMPMIRRKEKSKSLSRDISASPKRGKTFLEDTNTMASVLLSGLNESVAKEVIKERSSDATENLSRKSRSHKKHQRQKSVSWSPESKRDRKKRKRSRGSTHHHRRKKRRSDSRSRSGGGHSKSRRSSHKKQKSKHSSHREKERSRKKKHKRKRSPSSVSSLPSSPSSSISEPSSLPSDSDSDGEVQVIESDDAKKSSRESSVVSLPSVSSASRSSDVKKQSVEPMMDTDKSSSKVVISASGGEEDTCPSPVLTPTMRYTRTLFPPAENSNSSEATVEAEKKPVFNPSTSTAMAKIAQGLRAKLNALLEKENKLE